MANESDEAASALGLPHFDGFVAGARGQVLAALQVPPFGLRLRPLALLGLVRVGCSAPPALASHLVLYLL